MIALAKRCMRLLDKLGWFNVGNFFQMAIYFFCHCVLCHTRSERFPKERTEERYKEWFIRTGIGPNKQLQRRF